MAWREAQGESFFSAKDEQVQAFHRRSVLRECLLSPWMVDLNQALNRQAYVEASEASFVSFDRLDDQ